MTSAQYKFINWYFSSASVVLDNEIEYNKKMIANFVCESLPVFKSAPCDKKNTIYLEKFTPAVSNKVIINGLNKMINTIKCNREVFHNVLIHGSYSSDDYSIGWSDLDALVIIKNDVFNDCHKLIKARELVMQCISELRIIDPLCHHEFQIIPEECLRDFQTNWLPISVIKKSKSILSTDITIKSSDRTANSVDAIRSFSETLQAACDTGYLDHHPWKGEYLLDNYDNYQNGMYQLKYLLSVVVLMPALYFTAKGRSMTKPEAIEMAKKEMPFIDYEILDKATEIRLKWSIQESHPYIGNGIPKWLINDLGYDYFGRSYKFVYSILDNLISINVK